jgi:hypothetical protein
MIKKTAVTAPGGKEKPQPFSRIQSGRRYAKSPPVGLNDSPSGALSSNPQHYGVLRLPGAAALLVTTGPIARITSCVMSSCLW